MENESNLNMNGCNDMSIDEDLTARTESLIFNPTPVNWKTKNISINSFKPVTSYQILPNSHVNSHTIKNNESTCPGCCSKCQIDSSWCLSCGKFLDNANNLSLNNSYDLDSSDNAYNLDLSNLKIQHDDSSLSTMDVDNDLNSTVQNNEFNPYAFSANHPIVPPLDLSNIHTNGNGSAKIPKSNIDEKENVRRWASSSFAWIDMPVEILRKKPANHNRVKLNSFTNHHAPRETYSTTNEMMDEVARSTPNYPVAQYLTPANNNQWQYLPTEMWLRIMSFLPQSSLSNLQKTCHRLYEIGMDPQFWQSITLNKHHELSDELLLNIANRQPRELHFINCLGTNLTLPVLSEMLKRVGSKLSKLSFISCSKGAFESDNFLQLSTQICPYISHINASYLLNMDDRTLIMMSQGYSHISAISLMGSCSITNRGIQALINNHYRSITHVDFYGCFKVNNETLGLLESCENLESVALGSITKLGRTNLIKLLSKLPKIRNLDLRGTLNLVDDALLSQICDQCPGLRSLILTNSARLSTKGLIQLADSSVCNTLELLDVCGCSNVTDKALIYMLDKCRVLKDLDISCTSITSKGFKSFPKLLPPRLEVLRVNNNRLLTNCELSMIVDSCKKLKCVYLCGSTSIKNWFQFKRNHPNITFHHD